MKIPKKVLEDYSMEKYGYFIKYKTKEAQDNKYKELEDEYINNNLELIKKQKDAISDKNKNKYQEVTKPFNTKLKNYKTLVESPPKESTVFAIKTRSQSSLVKNNVENGKKLKSAKIIQKTYRDYLYNTKLKFKVEYDHSIKKIVEHYNFNFSDKPTLNSAISTYNEGTIKYDNDEDKILIYCLSLQIYYYTIIN